MKTILNFLMVMLIVACSSSSTESQENQWQGKWLRSDGTYQLILEPAADGTLSATYLNPKSIRVQKTELKTSGEKEHLIVVLNDIGYPGAVYDLVYSPTADRLVGTYYNPNAGQTYDIAFERVPQP